MLFTSQVTVFYNLLLRVSQVIISGNVSSMTAMTYSRAVGLFVRKYRIEHQITLETIARHGRVLGARWSVSSIQAIESGRAAPTLPTLLTLGLVLGDLTGRRLTLLDLLGDAETFGQPPLSRRNQPVGRSFVARALKGKPLELRETDFDHPIEHNWSGQGPEPLPGEETSESRSLDGSGPITGTPPLRPSERSGQLDALLEDSQLPPEPDWNQDETVVSDVLPPSLAERRAARRLGIEATQLQRLADRLWGRSIEEESARRAGEGSTSQARGRVTRLLVAELQQTLKEGSWDDQD